MNIFSVIFASAGLNLAIFAFATFACVVYSFVIKFVSRGEKEVDNYVIQSTAKLLGYTKSESKGYYITKQSTELPRETIFIIALLYIINFYALLLLIVTIPLITLVIAIVVGATYAARWAYDLQKTVRTGTKSSCCKDAPNKEDNSLGKDGCQEG